MVSATGSTEGISLPSGATSQTRGPHTGQALGCAWKRRFEGIVVLGLAGRAHFEARHGGLRAVVGNAARDGEARAAVGAVEEGIAVAAVVGTKQLAQAVSAGGRVGGNAGGDLAARLAGDDAEFFFSFWRNVADNDRIDAREGRSFGVEAAAKGFDAIGGSLDLDGHAAGIVADEAGQSLFLREAVDEGTKADALHDAAHREGFAPLPTLRAVLVLDWFRGSTQCLAQETRIAHGMRSRLFAHPMPSDRSDLASARAKGEDG